MDYLTNPKLLNNALKSISETVLINGEKRQAVITTAYLGVQEKRHITSLEPFRAGDIVTYRDVDYLISEEVQSKRHNKYRSTMDACNYAFVVRDLLGREIVGYNAQGRPMFEDIYSEPYEIPAVMKQWERSALDKSFAINMMEVTFFIDVQDNLKNREQFKINNVYNIKGRDMQVALLEQSRNGILGVLFLTSGKTAPY